MLDDACSLNNASLADVDSIFDTQDILSSAIVIKGSISYAKVSWPEAVPDRGTVTHSIDKASNTLSYGTFGKASINLDQVDNVGRSEDEEEVLLDNNDSGMSSEENEDSYNANVYNNNGNLRSVSRTLDDSAVVQTKCLTNDARSVYRNEIPCCSKDVVNKNVSVNTDVYARYNSADVLNDNEIINSEFIVIDLTCDVDNAREPSNFGKEMIGTNVYNVDCDNASIMSVDSNQTLVPVVNNEIVVSENQKLVSLSLSILLAALLQAMRCFAQFIEDIVIPQR